MFTVLSKPNCGHCVQVKQALKIKGLPFEEIIHETQEQINDFISKGFRTFPQVFDGEVHIGGNDQTQIYLLDKYT